MSKRGRSAVWKACVLGVFASTVVLVGSEFLPHTQGLRDWRGGGWFQDPFEYERGSLTGWEYGDGWVTVPVAAVAALCVVGYLALRRRALLIGVAVAMRGDSDDPPKLTKRQAQAVVSKEAGEQMTCTRLPNATEVTGYPSMSFSEDFQLWKCRTAGNEGSCWVIEYSYADKFWYTDDERGTTNYLGDYIWACTDAR